MSWYRWDNADLLLEVKLQPGASRSEFAGMHAGHLKLRIHAPAIDGKANNQLVTFLADAFFTAKNQISIERGELSRLKILRISAPSRLPEALLQLGLRRE